MRNMSTDSNKLQPEESEDALRNMAHEAMRALGPLNADVPASLGGRAFARLCAAEKAENEHQEAVLRRALEPLAITTVDAPHGLARRTVMHVLSHSGNTARFVLLRSQWFKGLIAASVLFFAAVVNLPALTEIVQRSDMEDACAGNLYALGNLLHQYKEQYGAYPYTEGKSLLSALRDSEMEVFMDMVASPMSRDLVPYESVVCDLNTYSVELGGVMPVAWTQPGMHRGGVCVLFLNGRVEVLSEEELARMLRVYSLARVIN